MNFKIQDKDNMIDRLIASIEVKEEQLIWSELWSQALKELLSTMWSEHKAIVENGVRMILEDGQACRKGNYDNLSMTAAQMVWFHCFDKIHNPDRKHPLFLGPSVAKVYLEDDNATAFPLCKKCGYWYPGGHYFESCPHCESCS
jgi:hypothetical protein